ncbi:Hypothetical predicted protein [Octopus vulgaris]|uniref:Fanconi anemia group B protein n=1 Tax=Octopus vulgaris TaxID=6645 RepID=A0AA36BD06_OCTVU|nr:Hypothetical predicted protein [Octopus vulgaris]
MTSCQNIVASEEGIIHNFTIDTFISNLNDETYRFEYCKSTSSNCQQLSLSRHSLCNLSLPSIGEWTIISAENIKEISTGKTITCAFLQCLGEQQVTFIIVSYCSDKLLPLRHYVIDTKQPELAVTSKIKSMCENVQLVDGPSLMWISDSQLQLALSSDASYELELKTVRLDRLLYPERSYNNFKLLCCYDLINMSLIIGHVFDKHKNRKKSEYFGVMFNQSFNSFQTIDISRILPLAHSATIQHLFITHCSMSIKAKQQGSNEWADTLQVRMFVFTEERYLMEVHNGKLLRCFNIPQPETSFSSLTTLYKGYECSSPILHTSDYEVHVVAAQLDKVKFVIKDVNKIFVQDFLQCGTQQLLFLGLHGNEETEGSELVKFWLLTDLECHHFQHGNADLMKLVQDENTAFNDGDFCPPAVGEVLLQQIQQDVLTLEEKNRLIDAQNQFISDICHLLNSEGSRSLLSPDSGNPFRMMTFIKGSPRVVETKRTKPAELDVEIVDVWQKIVGEQWVVGVDFKPTVSRKFRNVSLLVMSDQEHNNISASGNCLLNHLHTTGKRSPTMTTTSDKTDVKHFSGTETITCTLDTLPKIGVKPTSKFLVFLHCCDSNCETESSVSYLVPCGAVSFDPETLLNTMPLHQQVLALTESISTEEMKRSLIAFNSVQNCWKFIIKSRLTNLMSMNDWFQSQQELSWSSHLERFAFLLPGGPFNQVQIAVSYSHLHECSIHIYAHKESSILPVLHFLYSRLPDDVLILPQTDRDKHEVVNFLQTLHHQLQATSEVLLKFSQDNKDELNEGSASQGGHHANEPREMMPSALKKMRYEWEAKRKKLHSQWTLSGDQLKDFAAAWHTFRKRSTITSDIFSKS